MCFLIENVFNVPLPPPPSLAHRNNLPFALSMVTHSAMFSVMSSVTKSANSTDLETFKNVVHNQISKVKVCHCHDYIMQW